MRDSNQVFFIFLNCFFACFVLHDDILIPIWEMPKVQFFQGLRQGKPLSNLEYQYKFSPKQVEV